MNPKEITQHVCLNKNENKRCNENSTKDISNNNIEKKVAKCTKSVDISNFESRKKKIKVQLLPIDVRHHQIMLKKGYSHALELNCKGTKKIRKIISHLTKKWSEAVTAEYDKWKPIALTLNEKPLNKQNNMCDDAQIESCRVWGENCEDICLADVCNKMGKPQALKLYYKFGEKKLILKQKDVQCKKEEVVQTFLPKTDPAQQPETLLKSSNTEEPGESIPEDISASTKHESEIIGETSLDNNFNMEMSYSENSILTRELQSALGQQLDLGLGSFINSDWNKELDETQDLNLNMDLSDLPSFSCGTPSKSNAASNVTPCKIFGKNSAFLSNNDSVDTPMSRRKHTNEDDMRAESFLQLVTPALFTGTKLSTKLKRKEIQSSRCETKTSRPAKKKRRICPSLILNT